jgi:hypothetical protein
MCVVNLSHAGIFQMVGHVIYFDVTECHVKWRRGRWEIIFFDSELKII